MAILYLLFKDLSQCGCNLYTSTTFVYTHNTVMHNSFKTFLVEVGLQHTTDNMMQRNHRITIHVHARTWLQLQEEISKHVLCTITAIVKENLGRDSR